MKRIKLNYLLPIVIGFSICIISCNSRGKKNLTPIKTENTKEISNYDSTFLEKYSFKDIPMIDSTNFDNFHNTAGLTKDQMLLLKLDQICSPNSPDRIKAFVDYRLNLSTKYRSIVITYSPVEEILTTVLANYDLVYNLVDFKQIAYDEIFDSWSQTLTEIKENKLFVTNIDYSTGKPLKKLKTFTIDEDGKIKASH
jgi:hypothetical protein